MNKPQPAKRFFSMLPPGAAKVFIKRVGNGIYIDFKTNESEECHVLPTYEEAGDKIKELLSKQSDAPHSAGSVSETPEADRA